MVAKIFCAGFDKHERAAVEGEVKPVLSTRPSDEAWTISVVKTGSRLAVSIDGPDERLRGKSLVAELPELREKLTHLLINSGFPVNAAPIPAPPTPPRSVAPPSRPLAPPTSRPVAPPSPARTVVPAPSPKSVRTPPSVKPQPTRPSPTTPLASKARPAAPPITPPAPPPITHHPPSDEEYDWESPHASGERRITHQCPRCHGRFAVVYDAVPNEPSQRVSIACPHCWERDQVEIGEAAALSKIYRADKLKD